MASVTIEEAQKQLPELLTGLQPGEEILITDHGQPVAQVKKMERTSWPCKAGSARGKIHLGQDFDARSMSSGSTGSEPPARYPCSPLVPRRRPAAGPRV